MLPVQSELWLIMIYYVARQLLPLSILKVSIFHYNVMVLSVLISKKAVPFIYNQCVQIGMGGDSNTAVYCTVIMCIK